MKNFFLFLIPIFLVGNLFSNNNKYDCEIFKSEDECLEAGCIVIEV